jgi:hypothetical protein
MKPRMLTSARVLLGLVLLISASTAMPSCKSSKKVAEKEAAELLARQTEQAKKDLIALLSDNNPKSLEEKERELAAIKALGLKDPEILTLIDKVEAKLAAEREAARQAANPVDKEATELQARQRALASALSGIARSGDVVDANRRIEETLRLFSSPEVPVLIVIAQEGSLKDYDRPTTIKRYLEYLKDTGNEPDVLSHVTMDNRGLISEVEFIKR